jgi:hypothetical protein
VFLIKFGERTSPKTALKMAHHQSATTTSMDDALSDLLTNLPSQPSSNKGLLDSLSSIRLKEQARDNGPSISASRQLLEKKKQAAEAEALVPAPVITNKVRNDPVHDAIVEVHAANMAEIVKRGGGRQKSKKANMRSKKDKERGSGYNERITTKTGGQERRKQRMNVFKKQY